MKETVHRSLDPQFDSTNRDLLAESVRSGGVPSRRDDLSRTVHRWQRAGRALNAADQPFARWMRVKIRANPIKDPAIRNDPLEAVVFSLFIELMKEEDCTKGNEYMVK